MIVWLWRAAKNTEVLGGSTGRFGPGWAIGGWFVPLANFVIPYLITRSIDRASSAPAPTDSAPRGAMPPDNAGLVRAWWALYLIGQVVSLTAIALACTTAVDAGQVRPVIVGAGIVQGVTWLLAGRVVAAVSAALDARRAESAHRIPDNAAEATEWGGTTGAGGGPGWYPDPGGAFDHRYWDGTAWTEHVSRAGAAEIAPVVSPAWHPDPTRRHHWRYWDGYAWTEHVSTDGQVAVDPPG
jgi:hypothetical protein